MYAFPLSKANRLKLAQVFRACPRVDISIECAIEGQLGKAFVDDISTPAAYCINAGPFWYFAGDARWGAGLMEEFPAYNLLMPSTDGWLEAAQEIFVPDLTSFPRYNFSSANLNASHLERLLHNSPHFPAVSPISAEVAARVASQPENYLELSDYDSVDDFIERSFGFAALEGETVMGAAYASLVYSQGIEVSIYVEEAYRQKGVATTLAAQLLLESLRRGLRPNWDAANPESCKLALKLGFQHAGSYQAYYHRRK